MAFHAWVLPIVAGVLLLACAGGATQLLLHGSGDPHAEPRAGAFLLTLVPTVLSLDWYRGSDPVPLLELKLSVLIAALAWFLRGSAVASVATLTLAVVLTWSGVGPRRLDNLHPIIFGVAALLKLTLPVEDLVAASGAGAADGFVYTVAERCWASRELPPGLARSLVAFHGTRLAAALTTAILGIQDLLDGLGFVAVLVLWKMQIQQRILREAEAAAAVRTITAAAFLLLGCGVYAAIGTLALLVKRVRELGVLLPLLIDAHEL